MNEWALVVWAKHATFLPATEAPTALNLYEREKKKHEPVI